MDYTSEVISVIKETLGPEKEIKVSDDLKDNLKLDSLDMTEVAMAIDDHFEIEIEDEDVAKIKATL